MAMTTERVNTVIVGAGRRGCRWATTCSGVACRSSSSRATPASAMPGDGAGTRCASSRPRKFTSLDGGRFLATATRSRPRTRWATTSKPTPGSSTPGSPEHARGPRVTPGRRLRGGGRRPARRGRQRRRGDGQPPARGGAGVCRRPRSVDRAESIRSTTGIRRSCGTALCSSRAPATRASRSPSMWCAATGCGWPAATPDTCRSTSTSGRRCVILMRLTLRFMFHRVLSIANPIGRRMRPKMLYGGGPLVRTRRTS